MTTITERLMNKENIVCSSVDELTTAFEELKADGILWRTGDEIQNCREEAERLFKRPYYTGERCIVVPYAGIIICHKYAVKGFTPAYTDSTNKNAVLCWEAVIPEYLRNVPINKWDTLIEEHKNT